MNVKKNVIKWILPVVVLLSACKKNDQPVATAPILQPAKGVYILSEGGFAANNSKLAYRDTAGVVSGDFFLQQNPSLTAGLGDLGNDMVIYGSKMYIVMNGSGNVTVLNAATGAFISQISFGGSGTSNKNPRYALGARGNLYVTAWDNSVSMIDTASLGITGAALVGATPEGLAIAGNFLYVANSGGLNYPDYDSTVSVVDLTTMLEIKKIKVGLNPQKIEVNSAGKVFVTAYGDAFATIPIPATVSVINSSTNLLETTLGSDYQFDHVRIFNDIAYFYNNYGGGNIKMYNTITNSLVRNNFITDGTLITTSYGLNIDEQNGDVYVTDAKDFVTAGEVTCFSAGGVRKLSFSIAPGVNPNKVLFVR